MKPLFTVIGTPHYERLVKKLLRAHRDLPALQGRASEILSVDPYNVSREHHIKKLEGVAAGECQFRLTMGRLALPVRHFRPGGMALLLRAAAGRDVSVAGAGRGGAGNSPIGARFDRTPRTNLGKNIVGSSGDSAVTWFCVALPSRGGAA